MLNSTEHPSADQIYTALKNRGSRISQATVYNNLNTLADSGKIIRISESGFPDRYDKNSRHDHLLCTVCGELTDFFYEDLTASVEKKLGFKISGYGLTVYCVCNRCKSKHKEEQHGKNKDI